MFADELMPLPETPEPALPLQLRIAQLVDLPLSRRGFIQGLLATTGGWIFGIALGSQARADAQDAAFAPLVWFSLAPSGDVTIVAHRSEMGTGIKTSLAQVLADELEVDWSRVRIVQADGDEAKYGSQNTDGSRSVRQFFTTMRQAGAVGRRMLEQAAAEVWGVAIDTVRAEQHQVLHAATGKALDYGALAAAAAKLPIPPTDTVPLKPRERWRYIGKGLPLADLRGIVTGAAQFGMDVKLADMKIAVVARPPVLGGHVKQHDASRALRIAGVEQIIEIPPFKAPHAFQPLGGIAVIASSTWAAIQGRRALEVEWEDGPNASYTSSRYREQLDATAKQPGKLLRNEGDVSAAFAAASQPGGGRLIEASYHLPHLAHASMETPVALARYADGQCECWAPTQHPMAARVAVAQALGIDVAQVTVHVTLLGGGFGRKSKPDFIAEAALLSKRIGAPVRVVWTREDDIRWDYYHAVSTTHFQASLDATGQVTGWLQRAVFPTIFSTFATGAKEGNSLELGLGFTDLPYAIPNLRIENGPATAHVRIGWLRSVCHIFHAFGISSFTDELAHAAGASPLEFQRMLLGPAREVTFKLERGITYPNHQEPLGTYPIDTGRMRRVLDRVAEAIDFTRARPRGRGVGLAVHRSFLSFCATAVEVEVSRQGALAILDVHVAIDCGTVVNSDRVRAQLEGGTIFGLSLARSGAITAQDGRIVQSNFHDYPVMRCNESPRALHTYIIETDAPPAGVGEVATPPAAPALTNAIFAATGQRIRDLPLTQHDLSW
jgi:isoquinoline 1-oxidoreductase beta subunit